MFREFLSHSPLLALPLMALVLFLVVFAGVVIFAFTRRRAEIAEAAALPLEEEDSHG
jgi:cbb3-type cytochrome oxidase subunit 3